MPTFSSIIAVCASLASVATAGLPKVPLPPKVSHGDLPINGTAFFEQYLDHNNPELGTFQQRYWWNLEWWQGPGSPVVLFQGGEDNGALFTGYLTNKTLSGVYAQEVGGAALLLEHRYWGESSPTDELTPKTMQYLTFEQALLDTVNFANNVELSFDKSGRTNADRAPWVLVGGSYSGAQAGWTAATLPGTFWAYHASSAPVEAIWDYWQYFVPIQKHFPQNCSTDIVAVVEYIDSILLGQDEQAKQDLKNQFQLGSLRDDDFAEALANGPYLGQTTSFSQTSAFWEFCDYVENVYADPPNTKAGPQGVGAQKALQGYAHWWNTVEFPGYCSSYGYWTDDYTAECFDSYNSSNPIYADKTLNNVADRQWMWLLCNEPYGAWQDAAPAGIPTIVSRLVTADYFFRQCGVFFQPDDGYTYASAYGKRANAVNAWTGGWYGTTERVNWAQGQYDPWREETVSSDFRPGGPLHNSSSNPIRMMTDGSHCYDLVMANAAANANVQEVVDEEVAQMKAWVAEYYTLHGPDGPWGFK